MILSKNVSVYEVNSFAKGVITDLHPIYMPDDAIYRSDCLVDVGWVKNGLGMYCLNFRTTEGGSVSFNNYRLFFIKDDTLYIVECYRLWNGQFYDDYQRVWRSVLGPTLYNLKKRIGSTILIEQVYDGYADYINWNLWVKTLKFLDKFLVVSHGVLLDFFNNRLNLVRNKVIDMEVYNGFLLLLQNDNKLVWSDYNRFDFSSGFAGETVLRNGVKLVKISDSLYIVCMNEIYRLDFVGYPTIWQLYKVIDLPESVLLPYHITNDGKKIYFLANNKLYMFDGNKVIFLNYLIKDYLKDVLESIDITRVYVKYDSDMRSVIIFDVSEGVKNNIISYNVDLENFSFMSCRLKKLIGSIEEDYEVFSCVPFIDSDFYFVNFNSSSGEANFVGYTYKDGLSFTTKEYSFANKGNPFIYKRLLRLEIVGDEIKDNVGSVSINGCEYSINSNFLDVDVIGKTFQLSFNLDKNVKISGLRFYYTSRGVV